MDRQGGNKRRQIYLPNVAIAMKMHAQAKELIMRQRELE